MRRLARFYFSKSHLMPEIYPALALLGAFLALLVLGWGFAILSQLLGLPSWAALAILILPILAVFYIALMAGLILAERLWKLFGIYGLLNVSGSPIERGFASFAGVKSDG